MAQTALEAALTPIAAKYLFESGYELVFPPPVEEARVRGKGEFPIEIIDAGGRRARRPIDVLGARWRNDREVEIAAIELKHTRWAVYDALGQAVQYQTVCDEVSIGTPQAVETDPLVRATLADLGIGYIQVDQAQARAYATVVPWVRKGSRFQPEDKARHVSCRIAPGLAFLEVTGNPILKYGFGGRTRLSAWYAEDFHKNLQWNCWHVCSDEAESDITSAGINVEIKPDIEEIVAGVDRVALDAVLSALPTGYTLDVQYCPNPSNPHIPNDRPVRESATARGLTTRATDALAHTPKGRRPQLTVQHELSRSTWMRFTRRDYVAWLTQVKSELGPVMELMRQAYKH